MSKSPKAAKKVVAAAKPEVAAAPPEAPAKEVKESKKKLAGATPAPSSAVYVMGEAKYNPRVEHNAEAWSKVVAAITIKGKGKASHAELCEVLAAHFTKVTENHHDFIGYMTRRGSLKIQA